MPSPLEILAGPILSRQIARARISVIVREYPGLTVRDLYDELVRRRWVVPSAVGPASLGLDPEHRVYPKGYQP